MSNHAHAAATPHPESNPLPSPPAVPAAAEPGRVNHPGQFNQRQLGEISKLEVLIPIARETGAVGPLEDREVTETFLAEAEGRITEARRSSVRAANSTVAGVAATGAAEGTSQELMKWLRLFQAAGRLQWQQSNRVKLGRYLIGSRINQSRPLLEQSAEIIIAAASEDHPPSITEDMVAEAKDRLKAYKKSPLSQRTEKAEAAGVRMARDAQVAQIIADRQQIQMAAESAWPWTNPANAGWRLKFRLPAKQPYTP